MNWILKLFRLSEEPGPKPPTRVDIEWEASGRGNAHRLFVLGIPPMPKRPKKPPATTGFR